MNAPFTNDGFMPHGMCFLWNPDVLALHVISDLLIATAYYSIPVILLWFIRKRSDLPFMRIFVMFSMFIVACGTTHLLDVWTIWHPAYWLSGGAKALTAIVSAATAVLLVRVVPAALALKSPEQLAAINEQLAKSELRYRTLTDSLPQMIGILDAGATLSYANKQWAIYTGAPVGEDALIHADRLVHPDDASIAAALFEAMKEPGQHRDELRIRRCDDTYRWHEVQFVPVESRSGPTDQWMFTCTDIEQQHVARAALADLTAQLLTNAVSERATTNTLREHNRLLSMAEEIAHVGYWRFDLTSSELLWSDEIYRTFGLPMTFKPALEEAIAVYHPNDRQLVSEHVEKAIAHGTPFSFEARVVRPDGEIRHIVSVGQSECGADQAVVAIFGVLQDVTDRKASDREQERLIVRFDVATRAARVGIWDWDIATDTIAWNPVMFALYGAADGQFEPTYSVWASSLHPEDRARAERELAEAAAGNHLFDTEFRVVWLNGDVRIMHAVADVLRDKDGAAHRIIGTNWDITEARALTDKLRQEHDAATLAAAHDPLTGLMNRRALEAWIGSGTPVEGTLISFAVEGLTAVNERGGAASGDATLRAVAAIIQDETREADRCARFGGDAFVVILPGVFSPRTVRNVSLRIASAVESLRPLGPGDDTSIRLSTGIAALSGAEPFPAALREAEMDRYRHGIVPSR